MDNKSKSAAGGMGCLETVGVVFIVLKLLEVEPVARWSWWMVLCPFWIPVVLVVFLAAVAGLLGAGKNRKTS